MRIYPKEPDLYTIYRRIKDEEIDLQPDFQRDLVWNKSKKQSLIDTILREWQFPPVFMVVPSKGEKLDVLDGQQRLNAIFEFYEDKFDIDGSIDPPDDRIRALNGMFYSQLPRDERARFDRFAVRVFELTDYKEDEPYELFFRLNQGSALTPAEKRNTFYGPVRDQVRDLVGVMGEKSLNIDRIGFNNSRLAYHDVMARFLYALSTQTINKKITDNLLVDFFRSGRPVAEESYAIAEYAISSLANAIKRKVRLNKSTLFTWLLFFSFRLKSDEFFTSFEMLREDVRGGQCSDPLLSFMMSIYQEKSSTSVNDAIPVQLRLLIIFMVGIYLNRIKSEHPIINSASRILYNLTEVNNLSEDRLIEFMTNERWGLR